MNARPAANFLYHELILASASPQRAALLHEYGFRFRVVPADIEELHKPNATPAQIAEDLAVRKAQAVAAKFATHIILGADTIVVSAGGEILEKPHDRDDAERMLKSKSGQSEQIITGYCLLSEHGCQSGTEISRVTYKQFGDDEVTQILDSGEWHNVAGALRVEGEQMKKIIKTTSGDYHNIIGLPVGKIAEILRSFPV